MEELSPEQSQQVEKFKKRDQEVKAHEKAQAPQIEAEAKAELTKKNTEGTNDKEKDQFTAVIPTLAGIAEPSHKISNIGRRINIAV